MAKKQTFLDEPLPENVKRHLRVVITESNEQGEFLTVPIDTLRNRTQDNSCIIEQGEHSFIKVCSFVNYKRQAATVMDAAFVVISLCHCAT